MTVTNERIILIGALVGLVFALAPITWPWARYLMTLVHEIGHMLAAWSVGHFVTGIKLHRGSGGYMTHYSGTSGSASYAWVSWWGYPFPAVVGLVLIWSGLNGWAGAALVAMTAIAGLVLLWSRSWHTALVITAVIAGTIAVLVLVGPDVRAGVVVGLGTALVIGALRGWGMVTRAVRRRGATTDANSLARSTHVPAALWLLSWALVIGACLWLAGGMLFELFVAEVPLDNLLAGS